MIEFLYASLICNVLFTHFFADFIMQSDWMARNKSTSFEALGAHVLTYTAFLALFTWTIWSPDNYLNLLYFVGFNGIMHFITDAITSRGTKYLWEKQDVHNFFVLIGLDQFIHAATLIFSFTYFYK